MCDECSAAAEGEEEEEEEYELEDEEDGPLDIEYVEVSRYPVVACRVAPGRCISGACVV